MTIPVKRLPAAAPRARLWLIEGGPGASGVADFPPVMAEWQRLDPGLEILTLDHRGVGQALRLSCPNEESGNSTDGTSIAVTEIASCAASVVKQYPDHLAHFTTTQAAYDLAALVERTRQPGVPTFLWGGSYGTYLVHRLLQVFPSLAQGVIVDSINPADASAYGQALGMESAGIALLRACAEQPTCAAHLGSDPVAYWRSLLDDVDRGHCAQLGMTRQTLRAFGTWLAVYHPIRQVLPATIYRLRRCAPADLVALVRLYAVISQNWIGDLPGFSQVLNMNIVASEMTVASTDLAPSDVAAFDRDRLFSIADLSTTYEASRRWPRYSDPLDDRWAETDTPILMLEGALDFLTPAARARQWRDHFTGAHQTYVEFPEGPHGVTWSTPMADNPERDCAAAITLAFLHDPQSTLDVSCAANVVPLDLAGDESSARTLFGTHSFWD